MPDDLSSNEQFQRALSVAESQFKKGKIAVRFGPSGKMRFIIEESSLKDALATAGIDEATFRSVFNEEIGPLLEAVVRGATEQYARAATQYRPLRNEDVQGRILMIQERALQVERSLVTPELRGRYTIKVSSKHPRLRNYGWEIARKSELSTKEQWLLSYATVSFETVRQLEDSSLGFNLYSLFSEVVGPGEFCVFDCDEGDLDDLIKQLQEAKAALRRTQGGHPA